MYKVFFNDSTIELSSEVNNSSNNNIVQIVESECYRFVNQFISAIKYGAKVQDCLILAIALFAYVIQAGFQQVDWFKTMKGISCLSGDWGYGICQKGKLRRKKLRKMLHYVRLKRSVDCRE